MGGAAGSGLARDDKAKPTCRWHRRTAVESYLSGYNLSKTTVTILSRARRLTLCMKGRGELAFDKSPRHRLIAHNKAYTRHTLTTHTLTHIPPPLSNNRPAPIVASKSRCCCCRCCCCRYIWNFLVEPSKYLDMRGSAISISCESWLAFHRLCGQLLQSAAHCTSFSRGSQ